MASGLRVGLGFDFHPFGSVIPLRLGGLEIPHSMGLKGHSDADALLHSVCDALLGAAGLKDIGSHFPDTDPRYEGISSDELLAEVYARVQQKGYAVVNLDVVVLAETPKIGPFVESIKANLGRLLTLDSEDIGIKATTMEQKGVVGRGEGIAVQAVVLLEKKAGSQDAAV